MKHLQSYLILKIFVNAYILQKNSLQNFSYFHGNNFIVGAMNYEVKTKYNL